jgi:hypothetical protein
VFDFDLCHQHPDKEDENAGFVQFSHFSVKEILTTERPIATQDGEAQVTDMNALNIWSTASTSVRGAATASPLRYEGLRKDVRRGRWLTMGTIAVAAEAAGRCVL